MCHGKHSGLSLLLAQCIQQPVLSSSLLRSFVACSTGDYLHTSLWFASRWVDKQDAGIRWTPKLTLTNLSVRKPRPWGAEEVVLLLLAVTLIRSGREALLRHAKKND